MSRVRLASFALACLLVVGCVQGETTVLVNPDGSAKIHLDVVSVMPVNFGPQPGGKKPEDETVEDLLRNSLRQTLESPGVAAWKDVSAEFLPNGKLKFVGTAYVKQLEEFDSKGGLFMMTPSFSAKREADGSLKLTARKDDNDFGTSKRKPKTPEEIKKMSDAELDKHVLRELIDLQSAKPLLTAFLSDAKVKTTYVLPGDVTAFSGVSRDGRKVFFTLDGNKMLANANKMLAQDRVTWRKLYREAKSADFLQDVIFDVDGGGNASVTVAKPEKHLFDYDKEVKDARAAYPQLRKKFGFGDDLMLPTGDAPSPKKGP
jgi:hypothetical protein